MIIPVDVEWVRHVWTAVVDFREPVVDDVVAGDAVVRVDDGQVIRVVEVLLGKNELVDDLVELVVLGEEAQSCPGLKGPLELGNRAGLELRDDLLELDALVCFRLHEWFSTDQGLTCEFDQKM